MLVLRRLDHPQWVRLKRCGNCRVSLVQIVGLFRSVESRVIWLEGDL